MPKAKKYILLCCCLCLFCNLLQAQTDPQIGQYMFFQSSYNPAAAGNDDMMNIAGLHRLHTTGLSDMPMTTYFTVSAPFHIANTKHGAGVRFLNDIYGAERYAREIGMSIDVLTWPQLKKLREDYKNSQE